MCSKLKHLYSGQPQGIAPTSDLQLLRATTRDCPMNIFVSLHKKIVVGAILYGCPE
ncbi:MAG: hypothetical protein KAI83_00955 [Thiomargarita sp.]|nr:hypothetical protein [Thiomargarita sp.]